MKMRDAFEEYSLCREDHPDVPMDEDLIEVRPFEGGRVLIGTDSWVWTGPSSSISGSRDTIAEDLPGFEL